jgi:hypothetical protein
MFGINSLPTPTMLNDYTEIKIGFGRWPGLKLNFGQKNGYKVTNGKYEAEMRLNFETEFVDSKQSKM